MAKTIRLFVSSTFGDLKAERDALHAHVFPRLRALCDRQGWTFYPVDLRWGVSEAAAQSQLTMEICLREIRRSQQATARPRFLLLLGERYGWRPVPARIPAREFEALDLDPAAAELLASRYRRDDNAVPAEYVLKPRLGALRDPEVWGPIEQSMRAALSRAARALRITPQARAKYVDSATAQEVRLGIPRGDGDDGRALCAVRALAREPPLELVAELLDIDGTGSLDRAARRRQHLLQRRVRMAGPLVQVFTAGFHNGRMTTAHIPPLCRWTYRHLAATILREARVADREQPLDREIEAHRRFAETRARHFVGRASAVARLRGYLEGRSSAPLVVTGDSGSGKSALLAHVSRQVEATDAGPTLIARFVGATPESSSTRQLLQSLRAEIARRYGFELTELPADWNRLRADFADHLAHATGERPLVLYLDALDQLAEAGDPEKLGWLPASLPEHVRLVVSTLPGSVLEMLRRTVPARNVIALHRMPTREAGALLAAWLREAGRALQPRQRSALLRRFRASGLPLYLHVAAQQAQRWSSWSPPKRLGASVRAIVRQLLAQLSAPSGHGETMVSRSLGLIAAARFGLSEEELMDVLSHDPEVMADFKRRSPQSPEVSRLPDIVWSQLYADVEPYLVDRASDGASLLAFFHREVRTAVERAFLSGADRSARHAALARYFATQPVVRGAGAQRRYNVRKLAELPYQLLGAGRFDELYATLTSMELMYAQIAARGPQALIEDYERSLAGWPNTSAEDRDRRTALGALLDALTLGQPALTRDASQLPAQLLGRLRSQRSPRLQQVLGSAERWGEGCRLMPVRSSMTGPGPLLQTLFQSESNDVVNALAVSADGRCAVFASGGVLHVWDLEMERRRHPPLYGHESLIWSVAVTADGSRAVSTGNDRTVRRWDLERGHQLEPLGRHKDRIGALAMSGDGRLILAASDDGQLRLWTPGARRRMAILRGHGDQITALAISPDGRWGIAGTDRGTLEVWDLRTGRQHGPAVRFTGKGGAAIAFFPDGGRLVCGSHYGRSVTTWQIPSARRLHLRRGVNATDLHVSADGRLVVAAGIDELIRVWEPGSGRLWPTLKGHGDVVNSVRVLPGSRLLSASSDGTVKLWDLARARRAPSNWDHNEHVRALAVTPDGRRAVSASFDRTLKVWDLDDGMPVHTLRGHEHRVTRVVITTGGRRAVSSSFDRTVRIWDLESGVAMGDPLSRHDDVIYALALTPDDHHIVSGCWDTTLIVWSLDTGTLERTLEGHTKQVNGVAVSPDGRFAFSASDDGTIRRWDMRRRTRSYTLLESDGGFRDVLATAGGKVIAVPEWSGSVVTVVDARTGRTLHELDEHEEQLSAVVATVSGSLVLTASGSVLRVWDLRTGRCIHVLARHTDRVSDAQLTRDGRHAVSTASDGAVMVWDLLSGEMIARLDLDSRPRYCAISPDSRTVVVAEESGTVARVHVLRLEGV